MSDKLGRYRKFCEIDRKPANPRGARERHRSGKATNGRATTSTAARFMHRAGSQPTRKVRSI